VGFLFVLGGVLPVLAALDFPGFNEGKNAPDWVVGLAGVLFMLGGMAVWAHGTSAERMVSNIAGGVILIGLAAIGNWIAFGAGERACSGGFSAWIFSGERDAGEWECRAAFGIGAAMLDAIILLAFAGLLKSAFGPRAWISLLEKLAWGILLVALSPFLLLLIVFAFAQSGKDAARDKASRWLSRGSGGK
jgi:hypothetical protein